LPVKFDYYAEGLVQVVQIPRAGPRLPGQPAGLPFRLRQAVGILHVAHVAVFQRGVDAFGYERECAQYVVAPPQPAAHAHGGVDQRRGDESAAAPLAQPSQDVVEAGTALNQVEDRLLDPGPGWRSGWVPDGVEPPGAVEDQPRCRTAAFLTGEADPAVVPDRDINDPAQAVGQPVQFGCRVMAQHRARPAAQDPSPEHGFARRCPGIGRVNPAVERRPAAAPQLGVDSREAEADGGRLPSRDHTVLEVEQPRAVVGNVGRHNAQAGCLRAGLDAYPDRRWTARVTVTEMWTARPECRWR
jgi:hypothetical protein